MHLAKHVMIATCLFAASALHGQEITTTSAARFQQDKFAIGFWVDPPADDKMEQRYREIADANFTLVVGGFGAERQITRQLELCEQFGMKALVAVPGKDVAKSAPDHPALWGYLWNDEPSAADFPKLTSDVLQIRSLRPGKLTFINLLPNYAPAHALGTATYEEHVRRFVNEVKPDVLSMDHYPQFLPDRKRDMRQSYLDCVGVLRTESLRAGIPYWNFFNTMPYGPHTDPTEGQLRWQIFATLAHGAKGVLWFCYYTPGGHEFPKGGAIIGRDDKPTRHYDQARRINAELKNLGPTLMKLTSTRVAHVVRPEKGETVETTAPLLGGPIVSISGQPKPDCLVGEFTHADGRRAALLMNYDFAYTSWPTVEFSAPAASITEIDKATGQEIPLHDDSPALPGIQLSLDAGDGRLFLLPK
ncbi:MAG: hypothetical protein ACR2IE_13600 [Candidatus Sumerlaeaceae bacterium]